MKLYFPFPDTVRNLYMYKQECWLCKSNGNGKGGLEIHHITGREKTGTNKDSAFNSSVLCKECHSKMGHTQKEQRELFLVTLKFLKKDTCYVPSEYDIMFLYKHSKECFGLELKDILEILNNEDRTVQSLNEKGFKIRQYKNRI